MDAKQIQEMSDEDFANMAPPSLDEDQPKDKDDPKEPEEKEVIEEPETQKPEEESTESEEQEEESEPEEKETTPGDEEPKPEEKKEPEASKVPQIDYKQFYDTLMAPIKANGKELKIRDAQEAIKLMQMGANYTHKMQGLAPYRKKIQMLQNAGLLEDDKLNYLIDVAQGNPEAIKKLLKDRNIDPLDMNVSEDSKYVPGNHSVSDEEVRFQTVLDDLKSTPEGKETLSIVNGMDQASLNQVWKDPSIMSTLHEQRQNGVYKLITDEMEHQKMLGNIPETTSFLDAYKATGDYLLKQRQAQQQAQLPQGTLKQPVKEDTKRVKAAAPTGRSKKSNQTFVDPFSLSDEEFEKQFKDYIG